MQTQSCVVAGLCHGRCLMRKSETLMSGKKVYPAEAYRWVPTGEASESELVLVVNHMSSQTAEQGRLRDLARVLQHGLGFDGSGPICSRPVCYIVNQAMSDRNLCRQSLSLTATCETPPPRLCSWYSVVKLESSLMSSTARRRLTSASISFVVRINHRS